MPDLKQALKDFVATSNSGKYKDEKTLISKFPELAGYDIQTLKDYVATSNSGKYKDESTLNSKFPEFFTQKKIQIKVGFPIWELVLRALKVLTQIPAFLK